MKQFKKSSETNATKFISTMLQINSQFYCQEMIMILFFAMGQTQPIFYLYFPNYEYFQENIASINGQQMLLYFIRPEIIIMKYTSLTVLSIFPYILIVLLGIVKIGIFINIDNQDQRFAGILASKSFLKRWVTLLTSYYQQLLGMVMYYPVQTLIVCSITNAFNQFQIGNQGYLAQLIFVIIIFCIIESETIAHIFICKQSTSLEIIAFEKYVITALDMLIYFLQISQIILFGTIKQLEFSGHLQTALVISITGLQIINQLRSQGYIYWYQRFILYFINSIVFLFSLCQLFHIRSDSILIWPILMVNILHFDHQYQLDSLFSVFSNEKTKRINPYVYQLIKFSNNQNEIQTIHQSLIWASHKVKCQETTCICKDVINNVLDAKQANVVTENMFKKFIYARIKHLTKYIYEYHQGLSFDTSFYEITRATLFLRQGFILIAIKNYNKLLTLQGIDQRIRQLSGEKSLSNKGSHSNRRLSRKGQAQLQEIIKNQQQKSQKNEGFMNTLHISSLNIIRIKFLLNKAQKQLNQNFGNRINSPQESLMSDHIYYYLLHELDFNECLQIFMNLMKLKIEFYYHMLKCENIEADKIFNYLIRYFSQIINLEDNLIQKYEKFSSQKMRQLIVFFYAKLHNSFLKALKFQQINSNQQHQYIYKNQSIDFYSDKVSYILLQLQDDLQNLKIKSFSSNFLRLVGLATSDRQNVQFGDLLPEFIKEEHPILVQGFIQSGKAKFYRSLALTFIQQTNGLVKQMEQSFDTVTILNDNRVIFGAVIKEVLDQKAYMLVNVNGFLAGMTFMFLKKLGYSQEEIMNITDFYSFYDIEIALIVPNFTYLVENQSSDSKLENINFTFLDINAYSHDLGSKKSLNISSQNTRIWQESKYVKDYIVSLYVMKRDIFGFSYYIIEIETAILIEKNQNVAYSISQYKNTKMMGESAIFDVESLMLSLDEGAAKHINTLNIQERENYSVHMPSNNDQVYKQQDFERLYQVMLSPNQNHSISQLIDRSQNNIMSVQRHNSSFQQEFFCQQPANQIGEISSKELFSQNQAIKHNGDVPQSESSAGTSKKPFYFKKFQTIDQFYSTFNFSQQQIYICFIIFSFIVFSVFASLIIAILSSDLTTKIQEIEMLSFQANVVAPYERYLAIRAQIYYYNQMYANKIINKTYLADLNEPLYAMVPMCFNELKQNIFDSLLDENLKSFFKDLFTNAFFMGKTSGIIYSEHLTFREFILQLLHYQYQFKIIFDNRGPTSGFPCQVFQFANFLNFQDNLQGMSTEILTFSQNKCTQIINKWITIWICFIVSSFLLSLLVFYLKARLLQQYDTIIEVLSFLSDQSILKEIEKQKQILSTVQVSNDYLSNYQLRLQSEPQQNKVDNDILRKNKRKSFIRTSKFKSILFSSIIFGIFLIYSCFVTFSTESFLNQYQDTATFYKLVADLSFRSGNMFLYRETYMLWANLTYLNKSDAARLYNLIDIAQDMIVQYLDEAPRINLNSLLVPASFYDYFVEVQNNDVCLYLDDTYIKPLTPYCQKAFDGSLQNGMLSALSYIHQIIINQYAINNFTKRAEYTYYEVEGGQVASRVFTHMNDQLREGIIKMTQTFTNQNQVLYILQQLLSIIFLVGLIGLGLFIVLHYYKQMKIQLQLIKFGVLMIPQMDILKNDFYERFLKQIELKLGYKL